MLFYKLTPEMCSEAFLEKGLCTGFQPRVSWISVGDREVETPIFQPLSINTAHGAPPWDSWSSGSYWGLDTVVLSFWGVILLSLTHYLPITAKAQRHEKANYIVLVLSEKLRIKETHSKQKLVPSSTFRKGAADPNIIYCFQGLHYLAFG